MRLYSYSSPKGLFFRLFIGLLILFNVWDITNSSTPSIPGTIFICQALALLITTVIIIVKKKWRGVSYSWIIASLATLIIVWFSFFTFRTGISNPGTTSSTGTDGRLSVGYSCINGEQDKTIDRLTGYGGGFTTSGLTADLCVLKNIPWAASDMSPYSRDDTDTSEGFVLFFIYEAIIWGSFFAANKLIKTYKPKKTITAAL